MSTRPTLLAIIFFIFGLVRSACIRPDQLQFDGSNGETLEFLKLLEMTRTNESLYLGKNSFSTFYKVPDSNEQMIQVFDHVQRQSNLPLKIKAMLLNSAKQPLGQVRFAPMVYQSICVYDEAAHHKPQSYSVFLVKEFFHGDMDHVFQTDPVLMRHMSKTEKRLDFYIRIFEAYAELQKHKLKHCDIRPENILYKQVSENQFIPVFDNWNQITSFTSYCPDGQLAYMSPDENSLDTMFPSENQKKKTEMFGLALSILQIEANYFQTIQEEFIRSEKEAIDSSVDLKSKASANHQRSIMCPIGRP